MQTVSVIIPTHNRVELLNRVLDCIASGRVLPDEIIIVDDGSREPVESELRPGKLNMSRCRILRNDRPCGAATARNRGARAARGEVLIFIDDDVLPDTDVVYHHKEIHTQHPEISYGVMGRLYFDPELPRNPVMHFIEELGNFKSISKSADRHRELKGLISANFSVKREFMVSNNLFFNEKFPYSQSEDTEFSVRMMKSGWRLFFHIAPGARHHSPMTVENFLKKAWEGGVSKSYWVVERPDDTFFGLGLDQCIYRHRMRQGFEQEFERVKGVLGDAFMSSDISRVESNDLKLFLNVMPGALDWWKDLGLYDGWSRFVSDFETVAAHIGRAIAETDKGKAIPHYLNAVRANEHFFPATLSLTRALADRNRNAEAYRHLQRWSYRLEARKRMMILANRLGKTRESIMHAQRLYEAARPQTFVSCRYRIFAAEHLLGRSAKEQLSEDWLVQAWCDLTDEDIRENGRWVQHLFNALPRGLASSRNPGAAEVMERAALIDSSSQRLKQLQAREIPIDTSTPDPREYAAQARQPETVGPEPALLHWKSPDSKFGFIRTIRHGRLAFVHASSFRAGTLSNITPGTAMACELEETHLGFNAVSCRVAEKADGRSGYPDTDVFPPVVTPEQGLSLVRSRFGDIDARSALLLTRLLEKSEALRNNLAALIATSGESVEALCLACLESVCDRNRKTVAVIYHHHMWSQLGNGFAQALRDQQFNVLQFSLEKKYDYLEDLLPLDEKLFGRASFIDMCIGSWLPLWMTWGNGWLERLDVINIDRTARNYLHKYPGLWTQRFGKYVVRPVDPDQSQKHEKILPDLKIPRDAIGGRRVTYVMPLVPNKYERIRNVRGHLPESDINRILVCPTQSDVPEYFVREFGEDIIGHLLERYPAYKVVFRPRPEDRNQPEVKRIVQMFSPNPAFIVDATDDYTENYARGVLLITDRSSTGQTFTLSTYRPAVYFPKKRDGYIGVTVKDLLGVGCFRVDSLESLFDTVAGLLESDKFDPALVSKIADSAYSANYSFEGKIMQYLRCIAEGKVHEDWYSIEMNQSNIVESDAEGYERSLISLYETFDDHSGFQIAHGLNLLNRYLTCRKAEGGTVPARILEDAFVHHARVFKNSHSSYKYLYEVVRMVIHNLEVSENDECARIHLLKCMTLIDDQGDEETRKKFTFEVSRSRAAQNIIETERQALNSSRQETGPVSPGTLLQPDA